MRRYETIVIVDPDLSEDDRTSLFTRIKEIIPQQTGVLIEEEIWGAKKLAYEIKKKPRGFYVRYDYCGLGALVDEIERFFRIDDRVMKYLTVQLDPEADAEQILSEKAAATAGDETPAEAAEAAAATDAAESAPAPVAAETAKDQAESESDAPAETAQVETQTETSEKE